MRFALGIAVGIALVYLGVTGQVIVIAKRVTGLAGTGRSALGI